MNRVEFMTELERLLSDLPEEDRQAAVQYYADYFADAGVENEAEVIRELGRPERIAAMIRDSVKEKDGDWEYTENGYRPFCFGENEKYGIQTAGYDGSGLVGRKSMAGDFYDDRGGRMLQSSVFISPGQGGENRKLRREKAV